ncbi:tellurite resistance TerB C-terminal domain-containing protein [Acinetobacter sp. LUNF3]|nr:tellurite resistance TerB C-terminal domain-containing protein [Acinetobacter sp. LUNF3]UNT44759.1 TerB family tellurite resistance protein [Acinetobacter sp. LUNF3]
MIAKCDSTFHEKEKVLINKTIDEDSSISLSERSSLNAYFIWSMNSSVNTAGLKQQIESMDETNKISFRKILVQIALADGKIEATEIKQLEKLYTMLGIDKSLIPSDLHQYTTQKIISTQKQPTGGNITSFILDDSILAQHEAETKEVHTLLGSIFVEENIPEEKIEPVTLGSSLTIGLDKQHRVLFETLIDKEKWLREDIETICQKLNLMIDGALETINDWAYEIADAPVLEDDGDIYVDKEIVAELREE